ncbi:hypothetical protein HK102_007593 [Quaeritorhiza haematococci]|nr:hypothetical protein HK102_007593 [Quaeritorhiza haematococci]
MKQLLNHLDLGGHPNFVAVPKQLILDHHHGLHQKPVLNNVTALLTKGPAGPPVENRPIADLLKQKLSSSISSGEEDAFFIADIGEVERQHSRWKRLLPTIEPFYAVKCNPDPAVLKTLASLNTGFDCASKTEIQTILDLGIDPSRIIYANPCKQASHIRFAAANNVAHMTFDNSDELYKVKKYHPNAKMVLRILTDDSKSVCRFGIKFGAGLEAVPALLRVAKELEIDVVGISFHVGSGCFDASAFAEAVYNAKKAFDIGKDMGFDFDLLDIGGGFPGNHATAISFEQIVSVLAPAIKQHFPPTVRVIAEPGRYFVASAFTLAVNIVARRTIPRDRSSDDDADGADGVKGMDVDKIATGVEGVRSRDDHPSFMYYINDGMYGSFNCITFDHAVVTPKVLLRDNEFHYPTTHSSLALPSSSSSTSLNDTDSESSDSDTAYELEVDSESNTHLQPPSVSVDELPHYSCSIWGPTCDSIDLISKNASLPEMNVGDWMYFECMGAYTVCAASQL